MVDLTELPSNYSYRDGYLEAVMFAFMHGDQLLIEHRLEKNPPEAFIPNGKIENKDKKDDSQDYREVALRREISEEFGVEVSPTVLELIGDYKVDAIKVLFYIYLVKQWEGKIPEFSVEEGQKSADLEWTTLEAADQQFKYPVLHHVVEQLKNRA